MKRTKKRVRPPVARLIDNRAPPRKRQKLPPSRPEGGSSFSIDFNLRWSSRKKGDPESIPVRAHQPFWLPLVLKEMIQATGVWLFKIFYP